MLILKRGLHGVLFLKVPCFSLNGEAEITLPHTYNLMDWSYNWSLAKQWSLGGGAGDVCVCLCVLVKKRERERKSTNM